MIIIRDFMHAQDFTHGIPDFFYWYHLWGQNGENKQFTKISWFDVNPLSCPISPVILAHILAQPITNCNIFGLLTEPSYKVSRTTYCRVPEGRGLHQFCAPLRPPNFWYVCIIPRRNALPINQKYCI